MNSRILLSSVSLFASLALVTGATFAFFSDVGTSNDNVFAAGSLNLKLTDNNEPVQDSVTASFGGSALAPGQCLAIQTLELQNSGTVAANHAQISVVNTVTDPVPTASPAMDKFLRLETFRYDGGNLSVTDLNGNGFADLHDLAAAGVDNLALTNLNTNHLLELQVCLHADAPNAVQGDSVESDWTITLNQHASQ